MPRVVRLPPLTGIHGMPANNSQNHSTIHQLARRRRASLLTSDPVIDERPIDCVLVFTDLGRQTETDFEYYRNIFESYLTNKQKLTLQRVKSKTKKNVWFVKVHTPFDILLLTAEKIRMRLPIEKIEDDEDKKNDKAKSCWDRFVLWVKQPFRLDSSLEKNSSNYHTAIYSSKIDKFKDLFIELHGSIDAYFTPSERSLLTYELLARAHADDGIHEAPVTIRPALTTMGEFKTGAKRPGIDRLIGKKTYDGYFPLHEFARDDLTNVADKDLNDREKLQKYWATMKKCLKFQPLSLIRSYMGEKVAFYFALSGFYNLMLIPAALVGLIIFIYGAASVSTDQPSSDICGSFGQNTYMCPRCDKLCPFWKLSDSCLYSQISYVFDNIGTFIYGILMSLWARWFIEFWKRRQAVLQYEWDSIDFDEHLEPIRPEFESQAKKINKTYRPNPVTGIDEPFVPSGKRVPFFLLAALVVIVTMAIVCANVFATVVYRVQMDYILKKTSAKTYSSIIITVTSAVINLICSLLLSQLYYWLAKKITDWELHKYQSAYDDSLIIKIYLFQFVNFYSSLFYVAFFKGRFTEYPSTYGETGAGDFTEQCDPAGCFVELSIQLIIVMVGKQLVDNLIELIAASRRSCGCCCCCSKDEQNKHHDQWEIDNDLIDFDSNTLLEEYLELVIQFGFVTLFVVAFPLAPLFALINNLIEVRLDAWKLLSKYKRPIPYKASDIGIWSDILTAISYIAVLTNAVSLAWTSEFIPKMAYRTLVSGGTSLNGYVNWTLSSFPIQDYNATGLMTSDNLPIGLTYCRYRDFRSSTGPTYSYTTLYWNVLAARLAFIIVFEHVIFFIIYLMEWLVPDVPQKIQNKIDHERYIDQCERWAKPPIDHEFQVALTAADAVAKFSNLPNEHRKSSAKVNGISPTRQHTRRSRISPADKR